jgi:adenylyl cyclase-associated protein
MIVDCVFLYLFNFHFATMSVTFNDQMKQHFVEGYHADTTTDAPVKVSPEISQGVYIGRCLGGVFQVDSKSKSVTINGCKNIGVMISASVVARVEIINCQKVNVQIDGATPIVQIDGSERINLYMSAESCNATILSSRTQAININVPNPDDEEDMLELALPEMVKSTLVGKKFVHTTDVEA